jgi:SAM-dependent methyltransferase
MVKCSSCKFVYANVSDERIEAENFHSDTGQIQCYREIQTWVDRLWFRKIVERVTRRTGVGKVLDVGCGNGLLLREFVKHGWQAYGADPSPWATEAAEGYEVFGSTLDKAGLESNHFDAVTSTAVLEHLAQPRPYVEEVLRILKPGGCAYFNIPNYGSVTIKLGISTFPSNQPPCHANFFTHKTVRKLFSPFEDKIQKLTIRSYGIPQSYSLYVSVRRLLRRLIKRSKPHQSQSETAAEAKPTEVKSTEKTYQRIFGRLFSAMYYHAGRPLYLGDKLEFWVIKK